MFTNIGKSKFMKIVLFITTFAFVGTAFVALLVYKLSGNIQGVAEINGRTIPVAEYYYYLNLLTREAEAQGIEPDKKALRIEALKNAIDQELLYQEAQKEGVEATDEEVKQYLLDIPAFQEEGKFSKEKYFTFLSNINLSPQMFEQILKKELSIRHLLAIHRVSFYISEDELNTFVKKQLSRISGKVAIITPAVENPTQQEIEEYYKQNLKEFAGKKGKLITVYKIDKTLKDADKKAQKLFLSLKNNQQPSQEEGIQKIFSGEIYDKNVNLPEKVKEELDKLSKQKPILLVSTDKAYYLIKFEKEVSEPIPLEKVKEKVIASIKNKKLAEKTEELYKTVSKEIKTIKDLKSLSEKYHAEIKEIKNQPAQSIAMEYGIPLDKISLLTKAKPGQIIEPFKTSTGIVVIQIEKISQPENKAKEDMLNLMKPILTNTKYQTIIRMFIDKLQEEAEIKINKRIIQ
ncbi:peptidylprolyl isomerase [Persephonella sp. IF05-L8]|uniref:SurA N-terminal domain-containing protein n=1 Tax=Persephonella sp. IF05-L8 TaxID=1158338 RepID=UPI0004968A91